MKTITRFDYPALPANSTYTIRLMLNLIGEAITDSRKAPLNIALCIDNSGSMAGEKIDKVKEAASKMIAMLAPYDLASVVTFSEEIRTVAPLVKGADLRGVSDMISKITTEGCTNLSGGYQRAYELASEGQRIATSRIFLLTDGLANRGITSNDELCAIAKSFSDQGVTTSTIGAGLDFNETLMNDMAEIGGGSANYMEQPWEAVEIFSKELSDLRSITATNTRVRFTPGSSVVSSTLLNHFPDDGSGSWLVGDVYGNKERRIVLEMVIKTDAETTNLNLGTFDVSYELPGKGTNVPLHVPVNIAVVSAKEFATVTVNAEVTLEAALLCVGRAKREAMYLSRDQKFTEAADLLDRYVAALSGLNLNDIELERELSQLKDRAWNLRNRGKEFFTAAEQKRIHYESSISMSGKKEKYLAMMARRGGAQTAPDSSSIVVHSLIDNREFRVPCNPARIVAEFLKNVFIQLDGAVKPNSYGEWVLREVASSRIYSVGSSFAKAQGVREDCRTLSEVGLTGGLTLEVIALPPLNIRRQPGIPSNVVRVDLSLLTMAQNRRKDYTVSSSTIACDFLAAVYQDINTFVPPNSLGKMWCLRCADTGRIIDGGSAWARFYRLQADVRPIEKLGITGGSLLQAVRI